tara:strand:- start:10036 stop:10506 length:471 start_codon:yes stop_codon:yes gene_type:complete
MQKIIETSLGFIFKVESIEEFYQGLDDVYETTLLDTHNGSPFNKNCLKSYLSNPDVFKNFFAYGFMNLDDKVTAGIMWQKGFEYTTKSKTLTAFLWVSEEKKASLSLFKKSLEHINSFYKYDVLICGNSFNNKKLEKFYEKLNFKKVNYFYKNINH